MVTDEPRDRSPSGPSPADNVDRDAAQLAVKRSMRRDAWLAVLILVAFLLALAIWHYPEIGYFIVGVLVAAWESETLWAVVGMLAAVWFVNRCVLEPLGQIERMRREVQWLLRDVKAIKDHLGVPTDNG
jgi:hypothetical protein